MYKKTDGYVRMVSDMKKTENKENIFKIEDILKKLKTDSKIELSGKEFKDIRNYYEKTRNEFARELDVSESTITSIENNRRKISPKTYRRVIEYIRTKESDKLLCSQLTELDKLLFKRLFINQTKITDMNAVDEIVNSILESFVILSRQGYQMNMPERIAFWKEFAKTIANDKISEKNIISNENNNKNTKLDKADAVNKQLSLMDIL